MTEKIWFIFKGDHHLGPFSVQEILAKYHDGEVTYQDMLWKEGSPGWGPLGSQAEILEYLKPKLPEVKTPPIPNKPAPLTESIVQQDNISEEVAPPRFDPEPDLPPDLPPIPIDIESEVSTVIEPDFIENVEEEESETMDLDEEIEEEEVEVEDEEDEDTDEYEVESAEVQLPTFYKVLVGAGVVFGIILSVYLLQFSSTEKVNLSNITSGHRKYLAKVAELKGQDKIKYRLAPSRDGDALWLASNMKGEATMFLTLTSKPGRVLSEKKTVISSEAIFKNHYAYFDKLILTRGDQFVPGEYLLEIHIYPSGMMQTIARFLHENKIDLPIVEKIKKTTYRGSFIFTPGGETSIEKQITEYQDKVEKTQMKPLRDRLERYQTFKSLLRKVRILFEDYIGRITKGSSMKFFENKYNTQVGPILRDLILDCNRVHISLLNTNPTESEEYERLMAFGKDIGHLAAEMVTNVEKHKTINNKNRVPLKDKYVAEAERLDKLADDEIKIIEAEIKKIQDMWSK